MYILDDFLQFLSSTKSNMTCTIMNLKSTSLQELSPMARLLSGGATLCPRERERELLHCFIKQTDVQILSSPKRTASKGSINGNHKKKPLHPHPIISHHATISISHLEVRSIITKGRKRLILTNSSMSIINLPV